MSVESAALEKQLDAFWADLQTTLNPALSRDKAIMELGFRLYSNEQAALRHMSTGLVSGSVIQADSELFQVYLDLSSPHLSSCTCTQDQWCAHQLALFFAACQDTSKSAYDFFNDWQKTPHNPAAIPGVMRASDLLKTTTAADDGPDAWIKRIEHAAQERLSARSVQKNPYVVEYEGRHVHEHLLKQRPAKREWQPLYELYVSFGLLSFITELFSETTISKELLHRACSSFLFYIVEEAADAAEDIGMHALPFEFDPYIHYLRQESSSLLARKNHVFTAQRIDLYRQLWTALFKREAWRKEERLRLQALLEEKQELTVSIGYLHHLYLADELDSFTAFAKSLPDTGVDLYLFWLIDAFNTKQYEKARMLIRIVDQKLEGYLEQLEQGGSMQSRRFVHWFLTYIDTDWLMEKEPLLYKSLLERMLPYSYSELSFYFLQTEQYREWVELQLWMDSELPELDRNGLKEAAKQAPHEVLPLYHHGILRLIEERNRASYKKAVRYLKRLRTLYKKLKRTDRWDMYIHSLLETKKRLRAFQEECRKGQLTDA
ncbi:hypothetical protein AC623_18330 [Bacillus sp. FJAT-27231]|uniref:hypothetical protein n=1 Tax=Bacillus sp. FJAT-27231 TaxID=1679168 RepID=UPI0006710802|nr:hypothetical protein [Bacillus sp. FJAT-27231]KMY55645.1 hypothetical protein AC623_18330 [Bacillus sp. FJAT-27231]